MTVQLIPSAEQVAVAWISTIPGLMADGVATQLPDDARKWAANGFITVAVVGGSPDMYIPIRKPIIQVDGWAVNLGSGKPPWGKASGLLEQVRMATYDIRINNRVARPLGIRASGQVEYPPVRLLGAWPMTEPHRVYSDVGDYAKYVFTLAMHWVTIQPATING